LIVQTKAKKIRKFFFFFSHYLHHQQQQRYNKNVEGFSPFILHATEPSVQRDQPRGRVAKRRREKSHRAEVFR
jgi:hypothetical protein